MFKIKIIRISFLPALFFYSNFIFGQVGNEIVKDRLGNSYVAGNYSQKSASFGKYILDNKGEGDIFLAKYDSHGKIIWAKAIGGSGDEKLASIKIDSSDNILISASSRSKEINVSGSIFENTSGGKIFNSRFNADGTLLHSELPKNSYRQKTVQDDTTLTLTSPEAGNIWKVGTKGTIEWESQNISRVIIELSTDNGFSWDQLYVADIFDFENSFNLIVPNIRSNLCLVRISDFDNPDRADTSSAFSITGELFWETNESGFSSILISSFIVNPLTCWMAGFDGLIKTTDNGETWTSYLTGYGLLDIFFLNDTVGWTVGLSGIIFKTTNGGADWVQQDSVINSYLLQIFFADEKNGFMLGGNNLLRTTNGGDSWETQQPTDHTLMTMFFVNKNIGWIAGNEGVILKTTNAGTTWNEQQTSGTAYGTLTSLNFIDQNRGFASGSGLDVNGGVILKTTDGGDHWDLVHNGFNRFVFSVQFTGENTGWAAGDEGIMFNTSDGGQDWELQGSGTFNDLLSVNIKANSEGWVTGNGVILKYHQDPIDPTLPVELSGFDAVSQNGEIKLNWVTETEINNKGFEIEKKAEGRWFVIGFVQGSGTTTVSRSYSFSDKNAAPGDYYYRLKQINYDGTFEYSKIIDVKVSAKFAFKLEQNYPNPFNPTTTISFSLNQNVPVSLKIYDALGSEVATLINEEKNAGDYRINFNADSFSSGIYFYTLRAGSFTSTKKMLLVK